MQFVRFFISFFRCCVILLVSFLFACYITFSTDKTNLIKIGYKTIIGNLLKESVKQFCAWSFSNALLGYTDLFLHKTAGRRHLLSHVSRKERECWTGEVIARPEDKQFHKVTIFSTLVRLHVAVKEVWVVVLR